MIKLKIKNGIGESKKNTSWVYLVSITFEEKYQGKVIKKLKIRVKKKNFNVDINHFFQNLMLFKFYVIIGLIKYD